MSPDPGSDRLLTAATVALVVGDQFGIGASKVERLGKGWDNEAFLVDGEWIFRFPKRWDAIERMEREIAMMPIIGRCIDAPVPRFEMIGRASEAFAYPFVGYRRIAGISSDGEARSRDLNGLAADLGKALTDLHRIDPARMPPNPDKPPGPEEYRAELATQRLEVAPFVPQACVHEAEPYLRGEMEPPPAFAGTPRFLHADLYPDHVIVDPENGRLAGMIDFGDARASDPVVDFAGLVSIAGYGFTDNVREHYELDCDDGFDARLRWTARVLNLHWLANSVIDGREDVARRQMWVLRAFQH